MSSHTLPPSPAIDARCCMIMPPVRRERIHVAHELGHIVIRRRQYECLRRADTGLNIRRSAEWKL